jgi:hypothetical protein
MKEILRTHTVVSLLPVIALLIVLPVSAQAAQQAAPPSKALVVKQLTQRYTNNAHYTLPNITRLKVTVGAVRFGTPHIGSAYLDGTPANTRTLVFPVATASATVTFCNASSAHRYEYTGGRFGFFRDEFGDWTFKGTEKTNKYVKLASCPL